MKGFGFKNRKFQYGFLSSVFTILVVMILLIFNTVVGELSDRLGASLDLTENKIYGLSEETEEYLKGLDQDIAIHVLADEASLAAGNAYLMQLYQTLENYGKNRHITVDYINLTLKPTYLTRYPDYDLKENDVIVEGKNRISVLRLGDMLQANKEIDYASYTVSTSISASKAEQMLTNALITVSTEDLVTVSILTGYSEIPPDALGQLLENNSFLVKQQSLVTEEIDPEAEVAVLYGLQRDISEEILLKLDRWLDNDGKQGKSLLIFADPSAGELPAVGAFLKEWGMALGTGLAVETDPAKYYSYPYYPVAQYLDEEYAGNLLDSANPVIMALTKPLQTTDIAAGYAVTRLLGVSESAAIMDSGGEIEPTGQGADVLLLSVHTNYGTETNTSAVVLSGSYQAFSSALLTDSAFSNAEYLLGMLNKLTDRETVLRIAAKDFSAARHTLNSHQIYIRAFLFVFLLPLGLFGVGAAVWAKRRRL